MSPRAYAPPAGRAEMASRLLASVTAAVRLESELDEVAMRLLEVVADDLLELLAAAVEPAGEALVEVSALALRDAFVGRVADEDVAEAEGVVDRLVGTDQLLANERGQLCPCWAPAVWREFAKRLPLEVEPDDGRTLDDLALFVRKPVESGGEQCLDRRGHLVRRRAVREHREQLLDEEGIALRDLADARTPSFVERRARRAGSRSARRTRRPSSGSSVIASPLHARAARRAGPVERGRRGAWARRASSRQRARSGRAAGARPSGCPRRRA